MPSFSVSYANCEPSIEPVPMILTLNSPISPFLA